MTLSEYEQDYYQRYVSVNNIRTVTRSEFLANPAIETPFAVTDDDGRIIKMIVSAPLEQRDEPRFNPKCEKLVAAVAKYRDACQLQAKTGKNALACQEACEAMFTLIGGAA